MASNTDFPAESVIFDTSPNGRLFVPGYTWIYKTNFYAHGLQWSQRRPVTARELAMLELMEEITREGDWPKRVFQQDYLDQKWADIQKAQKSELDKRASYELPLPRHDPPVSRRQLINLAAWKWCIQELQDKARIYKVSGGMYHLYNVVTGICKHDNAVSPTLLESLRMDCELLVDSQKPKRRRGKKRKRHYVLQLDKANIVDPAAFPLVWRTSKFLADKVLSLNDCLEYLNSGVIAAELPNHKRFSNRLNKYSKFSKGHDLLLRNETLYGPSRMLRNVKSQWLPFDVSFVNADESKDKLSIKIMSYINSVHPVQFGQLYQDLEKLIEAAIDLWNQVLHEGEQRGLGVQFRNQQGRFPPRIKTWGIEWSDERHDGWCCGPCVMNENDGTGPRDCGQFRNRHWKHPEAREAYSYDDWKRGRVHRSVIPLRDQNGRIIPDLAHRYTFTKLQEEFRDRGLQLFVQITDIELSANNILVGGESWHLEGFLTEHISATLLLPITLENLEDAPTIEFRIPTDGGFTSGARIEEPLVEIFANRAPFDDVLGPQRSDSFQILGKTKLQAGQCIAWPNSMQSRLQAIKLAPGSKNGHLTYLKLMLVDPHHRICSTSNIPPQQKEWWYPEVREELRRIRVGSPDHGRRLPLELVDMILEYDIAPGMSINESNDAMEYSRTKRRMAEASEFGRW